MLAERNKISPEVQTDTQRALEAALAEEASQREISDEALQALAAKVAGKVDDVEAAKLELERVLDEFIKIRDRTAQGSYLGDPVDETMCRIAALN
jgi:pantothenate synthetase